MATAILARFSQALVGRRCLVERREHDWTFDFGGGCVIEVTAAWRLVGKEGVAFADRDDDVDKLKPWPLGGETFPAKALKRKRVEQVDLDPVTGDMRVVFDSKLRLEVFNNSATYEGWQACFAIDGQNVSLVGMPGGGISFVGAVSHSPMVEAHVES